MPLIRRLALGALLASGFLTGAAGAAPWPQDKSDIPADPAVLFGTLPNGLKYAVVHNETPKGAVILRLRFDAGSLQEDDDQRGLAHFLEHMAFRGSKHVAPDEVWKGLQRLGMTSGADANASTNYNETIYKLDLPHNDEATLATGFIRMRDTASELTLDQAAMDAERGPILSEERLRDNPRYRAYIARTEFLFPGSRATRRYPIGLTETIKTAPVSAIRRFYDAFYRPDRATFVVVGDIDPAAMEARIVETFGDWQPRGAEGRDPDLKTLAARKGSATLFQEPGAPSYLTLNWISPYRPENDKARQRANVVARLGFEILDRRFQALPQGAERPFANQGTQLGHDFNTFDTRSVYFEIKPGDWKPMLDIALREIGRIRAFGVTQSELDGVKADFRALIQSQADQAATRRSAAIANEIVQSVNDGEIYTSRAEQLAEYEEVLKTLERGEIDAALKTVLDGEGPFVFLSSPMPVEGGSAAIQAALDEAMTRPVAQAEERAVKPWPYTDFGPKGAVAERRPVDDLGVTFVRFANSVSLTIKPTKFQANQIAVNLRLGQGRLGLPKDVVSPFWAVQRGALVDGGLAALTLDEIKRALAGKFYGLGASLQDDAFVFSGQTRPGDLATQLQIMAAYLTAPGWRSIGLDGARTEQLNQIAQGTTSPTGVFNREGARLLAGGDARFSNAGAADVARTDQVALEAFLKPLLEKAPIELVIVGDVDVEQTIDAVAATIGALPQRDPYAAPSAEALALRFPKSGEAPVVVGHEGRPDQGIALVAWPTNDLFSDVQEVRNLRMLERIMQSRITERLRVEDGATYSPATALRTSDVFPGYGFLMAFAELPPAKMALFFEVTRAIAENLRDTVVSDDELDRARKPRIVALQTALQTNGFWVDALAASARDPRRLDLIRTAISGIEKVTPVDVQRVARRYLDETKAYRLRIERQEPAVK